MADQLLGRPLWYELLTTDVTGAKDFYTKVAGWGTAPFEDSPTPYTMWKNGTTLVGGVMALPPELAQQSVPPYWLMYVGVPNLGDAVSRVAELGGSTASLVIDVPNIGIMQVTKDPQDGVFAIYQPVDQPEPEAAPGAGDISWHELYTTDAAAAMKFYGDLFGWQATESMDMGAMGKYHMFGRGAGSMGGMMNKTPEMAGMPTAWTFYICVADVPKTIERVKAGGGQVLNGPMEVPGGDTIANCMDPQGAAFAIHQKKPA